jgi:hypothetical protein
MSATSRTKLPQHSKPPNMRVRRIFMSALLVGVLAVCVLAGLVTAAAVSQQHATASAVAKPLPSLADVRRVADPALRWTTAHSVPVLQYHEMNNGCLASASTCVAATDYESVSSRQFGIEMGYLYTHGYHTVTLPLYLKWLANKNTKLPPKPFLITVDNGIWNFLSGATVALYHYRYTATAFLVSGFANGAASSCVDDVNGFDVQPGCPGANAGWDATWAQLRSLSPAVWGFGIEAGPAGHYEQTYAGARCYVYDACLMPDETFSAYKARVTADQDTGAADIAAHLGKRFDGDAWVVPYSDLGYGCERISCATENHTDPHSWLTRWAGNTYGAVFVQDTYRNGKRNERFRFEVHNTTTLRQFTKDIRYYTRHGDWKW